MNWTGEIKGEIKGEMTGEIWERFRRDQKHLSHAQTPMNKGFLKQLWER